MNTYHFILYVNGSGDTPEEAWEDCKDSIAVDGVGTEVPQVDYIEDENGKQIIPEGWHEHEPGGWLEHDEYTMDMWAEEAAGLNTHIGYEDWVESQKEMNGDYDQEDADKGLINDGPNG